MVNGWPWETLNSCHAYSTIMNKEKTAYAVSIAGSDSSAGAGIQTDLKTMAACGAWGMTVIAALTAQNGNHVRSSYKVSQKFIYDQIAALEEEFPIGCYKTGMLMDKETVEAVASAIPIGRNIVVDPVLISTSGCRLLDKDAEETLIEKLLPRALIVTPNIPEAEELAGITINDEKSVLSAGDWFLETGSKAVIIKGGHRPNWGGIDYYIDKSGMKKLSTKQLPFKDIHGTGCCLSSAIASYIAKGYSVFEATKLGKTFVTEAIAHSIVYPAGRRTVHPLWREE